MAEIDKTGNYNDDIDAQLKAALEKFKQTQSW
jgi:F-type H+-transporting ATPase subunit alpha